MGWQGAAGHEDRTQCVLRRKGVLERAWSSTQLVECLLRVGEVLSLSPRTAQTGLGGTGL